MIDKDWLLLLHFDKMKNVVDKMKNVVDNVVDNAADVELLSDTGWFPDYEQGWPTPHMKTLSSQTGTKYSGDI